MNDIENNRIFSELSASRALSIKPNDIASESVKLIGICNRCGKPLKDWSDGGINLFQFGDCLGYSDCLTVLLCSKCYYDVRTRVMDFIYSEPSKSNNMENDEND